MKIAIMAAGAVGGYFGARLVQAGEDVLFFARGAHLESLQSDGLRIASAAGDVHIPHVKVAASPAGMAPVDIVLFAVKLWDTEAAAAQIKPIVGPSTRVITVQNGIDSAERLTPILGEDAVVDGVTYINTTITAPGAIRHTGTLAKIVCGRSDGRPDAQLEAFVRCASAAGIDIEQSPQIDVERWKKFTVLVGMSGVTASMRSPIGPILEDPDTREVFVALMQEVIAVARAEGIALPEQIIEDRLAVAEKTPGLRASMSYDLERGNRLELDWLSGCVVALGRKHGVPTPANQAVYATLKLHRNGAAARA